MIIMTETNHQLGTSTTASPQRAKLGAKEHQCPLHYFETLKQTNSKYKLETVPNQSVKYSLQVKILGKIPKINFILPIC